MPLGYGNYRYEVVPGWGQEHKVGVVSGLATDSKDRVYVVDRQPKPAIVVFDRQGRFLKSWGEDTFPLPHGIWIGPDDEVIVTDCRDHSVRICTTDGKVLKTLGTPGQVGAPGMPFNQPTRAVRAPSGDIYVSDGYGQTRVHRYSPDGKLLQSWGEPGTGPGQFYQGIPPWAKVPYSTVHSVFVDPRGRVFVADRDNQRVQIFDAKGTFLSEWTGLIYPCDLYIDAAGVVYVDEASTGRMSIFSPEGKLLSRWGEPGSTFEFKFGPHSMWVDSHGDIYVGEVGGENKLHKFARV
jgi:DNA-binding beta-propeller fold protein YncE